MCLTGWRATVIYDKGFNNNIIGDHDAKIKGIIQSQLDVDDLFINTTWLEITDELKSLLDKNPKRVICYSGPDWENTICRKEQNDFLKQYNPIYIGNTYGDHYFSFWLDFVYKHLDKYQSFKVDNSNIKKPFMCLNRKPHKHRVELVKSLDSLTSQGYVSLGTTPPITLDTDISNIEGDNAIAGDLGITNDITSLGHPHNWNTHFLNVVTETTIHTNVFLSEKVFKPILGMRPFVILGDDNIYNVLHDWGIDTFDDLFGTGYRGIWYTDRIKWITQVILDLSKEKDLTGLLLSLKPRLIENKKLFKEVALKNRLKIHNMEF